MTATAQRSAPSTERRPIHPGAWWTWAIGLAATSARTSNLAVLALIAAVVIAVVWACRVPSPLAHAHALFLRLALAVIVVRMILQIIFAPRLPGHVLFTLPEAELPAWAAGISIGGPVTLESLVGGFTAAARLALVMICIGAVNTLTTPSRLLRSLPAVLYEAGVAVTVALTATPQAVISTERLREARLLRGRPTRGPAALRGIAVPVLDGALSRSLTLAASMDARGYGRRALTGSNRRWSGAVLLIGLITLCIGAYAVLAPGSGRSLGPPALGAGTICCGAGLLWGSRGGVRTRYRPIRWDLRATLLAVSGAAPLVATFLVAPIDLEPPTVPLTLPSVPLAMVIGLVIALGPMIVAPSAEHDGVRR